MTSPIRFAICLAALWLFASAPFAQAVTPINVDAFSDNATSESFEGLRRSANFVINGPYARPGVMGPYTFPSQLVFSNPVPNPTSAETVVGDFSFEDGAGFGLGDNGDIEQASDVPFGTAYMGINRTFDDPDPLIEFILPNPSLRIGAYVTSVSGELTLTAYDESGQELGSHQIPSVHVDDWGENFLGLEAPGIHRVTFIGNGMVLDNVIFEVPEPSTSAGLYLALVAWLHLVRKKDTSSCPGR